MRKTSPSAPVRDWPAISAFRALVGAEATVMELHRRHLAKTYTLAPVEFDMVAELGNTQGMRMSDLAKKMITSPANVTRVASQLERRGWVERRRGTESDREVIASLTPAGDTFFQAHFREVVHFTKAVMESALTEEELSQLAALCQRIRSQARAPDAP